MKPKKKLSKARRIIDWIVILCIPIFLYSCTDRLIFFPPSASYNPSNHLVKIPVENGQSIAAYYLPTDNDSFVILYSHGNAEDIGQLRPFLQEYQLADFGILAYDYRGYGLSDGKASEQNTYQDITAAYQYLVNDENIDPDRIIIHGRSVGSGPSVWLASQYPSAGLILESPFVSIFRVRTHWKILPFDKYDNMGRIKKVDCPVMVIHGQSDRVIGFWHGQALFEAAAEPKMHYWVPNAGHNNLVYTSGDEYWNELDEFKTLVETFTKDNIVADVD